VENDDKFTANGVENVGVYIRYTFKEFVIRGLLAINLVMLKSGLLGISAIEATYTLHFYETILFILRTAAVT